MQNNNTIKYGDKTLEFSSEELSQLIDRGFNLSDQQTIIGSTETRDGFVLFTTDNAGDPKSDSVDCIWEITGALSQDYELKLVYVRNLEFSKKNPIQAIFNYENDRIRKVYWVDGYNQVRSLNLAADKIID